MQRGWTSLHENDCYLCEPFWGMQVAAAGSIGLINSVGNLGGFLGPYVLGQVKTLTVETATTQTFDANGRLILTNDGGIYARTSPGNNTGAWTSLNGNASLLETYAVGYDAIGKRLIAAAQVQRCRNPVRPQ